MLGPYANHQGRLDRVYFRAKDLQLTCVKMVGLEAIPEVSYTKQIRKKKFVKLPVLPSDHYGLLASWQISKSN